MGGILFILGGAMAFFVSVQRKNSLGVAIIHMLLGWFYLFYVGFCSKFIDGYKEFKDENYK